MNNNINIEELFRSNLQNMESTPPAGGFEAIQAKMAAKAAAGTTATTVAAKTGIGLAKIAAIATIAVGTGLGVGYFVFSGNDKKTEETKNQTTNSQTINNTDNNTVELPGDVHVTEINSVNKQGKVISIVEVKKGNETQKVLVEVNQSEKDKSPSIVGQWLSTDKNKNKYSQDLINKLLAQLDSDNETEVEPVIEPSNTNSEVKVQKLEENEVIAGIKANVWSGPAPLTVEFSNLTPADSYEWTFIDNGQAVKESAPRYTYTEPGNYLVILKVKNKAGKVYTDKVLITVEDKKAEEAVQEASIIPKSQPNVFTPNGDGKNEEYKLVGVKNIEVFKLTITDQKGQKYFETNDPSQGWDGTDAPEGNYIVTYTAKGKDKAEYNNRILIKLTR